MTNKYANLNKAELRAACKAAGVKYFGTMTNDGMREALAALDKKAAKVRATAKKPAKVAKEVTPKLVAKATIKQADILRESRVENPCRSVWDIAEAMRNENPDVRRKDVIAACVSRGIAFYTARTQYQEFTRCQKEMAERIAQQSKGK